MPRPDLSKVRLAFRNRLLDDLVGVIQDSDFNAENRQAPEGAKFWVRETMVVIKERDVDIGGATHESTGRMVYDVMTPIATGTTQGETLRDQIANLFNKKKALTNLPDIAVGIESIERPSGRAFDAFWWMSSVSIYWRVYATSPTPRTG